MNTVTAGVYESWLATLTGLDLETALAAGLDKPPIDDTGNDHHHHSGCEIREMDGLALFLKNGAPHPLQHESVRDHTLEEVEDYKETRPDEFGDLAAALRRIVEFLVGGMAPEEIFTRSRTVAQRVFVLCRALQLGDCEKPSLADIARATDLSRASLSKTSVQLRDAMGNHHLHFGGREEARETMKKATTAAWRRRRASANECQ
jgi:hypothetical protein